MIIEKNFKWSQLSICWNLKAPAKCNANNFKKIKFRSERIIYWKTTTSNMTSRIHLFDHS